MAIYFDFYKNPLTDPKEENYFVRAISNGTITTNDVKEYIQKSCSLTASDVEGCLSALSDLIYQKICEGNRVQLKGIGSFGATVDGSAEKDQKGNLRLRKGHVKSISFIPDGQLLRRVQSDAHLLRTPQPYGVSEEKTLEEIKAQLTTYLKEEKFMSSQTFCYLIGLSRSTSYRLLKKLTEEGFLDKKGTVYILKD